MFDGLTRQTDCLALLKVSGSGLLFSTASCLCCSRGLSIGVGSQLWGHRRHTALTALQGVLGFLLLGPLIVFSLACLLVIGGIQDAVMLLPLAWHLGFRGFMSLCFSCVLLIGASSMNHLLGQVGCVQCLNGCVDTTVGIWHDAFGSHGCLVPTDSTEWTMHRVTRDSCQSRRWHVRPTDLANSFTCRAF